MTTRSHQTGLAAIVVRVQTRERPALVPAWVEAVEIDMYGGIATLCSRLIEALHLNADSRIIHALVL